MAPSTSPPVIGRIISADAAISGAIHTAIKPILHPSLFLLLEISADFRFSFPVSLSLLISPSLRCFLLPFLAGLILDLLLVGLIKVTFRRSRPAYNHPSMSAAVSVDHFSFPSGHASRVFFVATFVHLFSAAFPLTAIDSGFLVGWIGDGVDLKGRILFWVWVWATLTAFSRVLLGRHFVLDVIAGAGLGVLEALLTLRFLRFEEMYSSMFSVSCTA